MFEGDETKKMLSPLLSSIVLALALYFSIWIVNYANLNFNINSPYLSGYSWFMNAYLWVFFAFSFIVGYWNYFYKKTPEKLEILKPAFYSFEVLFGAWLVVEIFSGLIILYGQNPALEFFKKFYYEQFWLLVVFVLAVYYGKMFLVKEDKNSEEKK